MNFVPIVVDKEGNGERSYDIYSKLLKNRIILLSGEITDEVSSSVVAQMLYLDSINHEDIYLYTGTSTSRKLGFVSNLIEYIEQKENISIMDDFSFKIL